MILDAAYLSSPETIIHKLWPFRPFNDADLFRLQLSNNANDIEFKIQCI